MAIQKKKLKVSCNNSSTIFSVDDVLFEVVARLPPKSLCVCKSVCKSWFSMISHSQFIKLYRNTRLLLSIRDGYDLFSNHRYLLGSTPSSSYFHEWLSVPYTKYDGVTLVINSLVCFYVACRVCLCNLTTCEVLDLAFSHYNRATWTHNYRYFFGFDPISATYKLLKIDHHNCEILTLGENMCEDSWKSVDAEPNLPFKSEPEAAFCVDGVLYWLQNKKVMSFHVNTHHFDSYFLPDYFNSNCAMLQSRGCLAFAYKCGSYFNIFRQSGENCNGSTTRTFKIPTELIQQCNNLIACGSRPTGEIMLVDADRFTAIYSYDPENQKLERFVATLQWKSKIVPLPLKAKMNLIRVFSLEANFSPLSLILKQN